jgi:hypothetical protein
MYRVPSVLKSLNVSPQEQEALSLSAFGLNPKEIRAKFDEFIIERIRSVFPMGIDEISVLNFLSSYGTTNEDIEPYVRMYNTIIETADFRNSSPEDVRTELLKYPNPDFCFSVVSQIRVHAGYTRMACMELLRYPDKRSFVLARLEETVRAQETLIDRYMSLRLLLMVASHTEFEVKRYSQTNEISVSGDYHEFGLSVRGLNPCNHELSLEELGRVAVHDPVPHSIVRKSTTIELIGHDPEYDYVVHVRKKYDLTDDDYRCGIAFMVQDYKTVLEYMTPRTNRCLMTTIVNELLKRGHEETGERVLEFISDQLNFDLEIRILMCYAFRGTPLESYRTRAVACLKWDSMTTIETVRVRSVMSP